MDKYQAKQLITISCCIDDLSPELYPHILDSLLKSGANDAWLTPIIMKKGRPGVKLEVLAEKKLKDLVCGLIFKETSSIGLKVQEIERIELERKEILISLDGNPISVKLAYLPNGDLANVKPEFDDCVRAADATGMSVKEVQKKAYILIDKEVRNA